VHEVDVGVEVQEWRRPTPLDEAALAEVRALRPDAPAVGRGPDGEVAVAPRMAVHPATVLPRSVHILRDAAGRIVGGVPPERSLAGVDPPPGHQVLRVDVPEATSVEEHVTPG
jgi:hypothetical protein